jgi:hypothetical protein
VPFGYQPDDLITAFCHIRVDGAKIVSAGVRLLGWQRLAPAIDPNWFIGRVQTMERWTGVWLTDLRSEGEDPAEVLSYARDMIRGLPPGVEVVGHNLLGSVLPRLGGHFEEWLGEDTSWQGRIPIHDVGLMHKARAGGINRFSCDSKRGFLTRVASERLQGVRWNLRHCVEQEPLVRKTRWLYSDAEWCQRLGSRIWGAVSSHLLFEHQQGTLAGGWGDFLHRNPPGANLIAKAE